MNTTLRSKALGISLVLVTAFSALTVNALISDAPAQAASKASVNLPSDAYTWYQRGPAFTSAPGDNTFLSWSGISAPGPYYIQGSADGKSGWRNFSTLNTNRNGGSYSFSYVLPNSSTNKTIYYRLYHPGTSRVNEWANKPQKVTYVSAKSGFGKNSLLGPVKKWPVNQPKGFRFYNFNGGGNRVVYMQRLVKGKWENLHRFKVAGSAKNFSHTEGTPQNATYRLYFPAQGRWSSATSRTFTQRYEDPRRYTDTLRKKSYNYMKKACPNVTLETVNRQKSSGLAMMYERRIIMRNDMAKAQPAVLKQMSLHECAHVIQGEVYSNHDELSRRADKVYRQRNGKGMEMQADCMAQLMGGNAKLSGYHTHCGKVENAAARKVLARKKF